MYNCTFEIHHINGEILADNLIFDDLPELFQAYQEWYGEGSVVSCYRTLGKKLKPLNRVEEFYTEWLKLFDHLMVLDNI